MTQDPPPRAAGRSLPAPGRPGLLLVGSRPPPSGGVATHVGDLARLAARRGWAVRIAAVGTGRAAARPALALELAWARLGGAVVHLHTNGHNARSWQLARLVGAVAGERAVLTLHSGLAPHWIAGHARGCRAACAGFGAIVCVSPAIGDALAAAGVAASRILIAPAFCASALPLPLPPPGLAAIRRRHRPLVAAAVAEGRQYGADVLVEGVALLRRSMPDAGLAIYGPAARAAPLVDALRALGLGDCAHCLGDLDRAAALAVVAAADVFVRPTRADGDSISVREALALGRRVVASDAAARPDGVTCFASGSAAALAQALAQALAAPPPEARAGDALEPVLDRYERLLLSPSGGARAPARNGAGPPASMGRAAMQQGGG